MMEGGAEWGSFNGANSVNEEADFMAQLFPNCANNNELESSNATLSSSCYSGMTGGDSVAYFPNDDPKNMYCLSQSQGSSSISTSTTVAYPYQGTYCLSDAYDFFPVEYYPSVPKHFPELNLEVSCGGSNHFQDHQPEFSDKIVQLKQEFEEPVVEDAKCSHLSDNYGGRKRTRVSEKGRRNIRSKKNEKIVSDDDEQDNNNGGEVTRQNSSSCSEEELSGVASSSLSSKGAAAVNLYGKTRASRGAATDPQSLYARKRRERINERLKILQNLVPNGTKVDISTMLEEAVHYVKFLQLQIKLLSSDELWMYAPLAYNGMDIGLDSKIRALL